MHKPKDGPLHWTVERGDLLATERLLKIQPEGINEPGTDQLTALHWAARRGHVEVSTSSALRHPYSLRHVLLRSYENEED
jgi:ankyrin repeat protein